MVSTNIQQGKVLKTLNGMRAAQQEENAIETRGIKSCDAIDGAVARQDVDFPMCKCKDHNSVLFCGTDKILDIKREQQRKFDVNAVKEDSSCKYATPYCSQV